MSAGPLPISRSATAAVKVSGEETVFFFTRAGGHRVLGRSDAQGRCKAFLGGAGQGWMAYPDTHLDGDDLMVMAGNDGQLALITSRGGAVNLCLVSTDGRALEAVTENDGGIVAAADVNPQSAAFSSDGKRLAWVQDGSAWVTDLAKRQPHTLSQLKGVDAVAWSPDDKWLAVSTGSSIHKVGPDGEPDFVLVPYGVTQPFLVWDPDAKAESVYFLGMGLRRVNQQRKIDMLIPSSVNPNRVSLLSGAKDAVLLAVAPGGHVEAFRGSLGGKPALTQITLGGAAGVWSLGKSLYFLRGNVLWRSELDGSKARTLVDVPVEAVTVGVVAPLKGVCP